MQIADAHCTVRFRQVAPVCHSLHILHPFFPQGRVCHHLKRQSSNDVLHASALGRHLQEIVHLSSNPGAVAGRVGIQGPVHEGVIIPQDASKLHQKRNQYRPDNDLDLRFHPGSFVFVPALHSEGTRSLAIETHVLGKALQGQRLDFDE